MKDKIKPFGRIIYWILGALYDFRRFYKYGGWRINLKNKEQRNYFVSKIYHSLEKSMSFSNRNLDSGWSNAYILVHALDIACKENNIGFHDNIGINVLKKFIKANNGITKNIISDKVRIKYKEISSYFIDNSSSDCGVVSLSIDDLNKGLLLNPDDFFLSRYSIREFDSERISILDLHKAIQLSLKTPSACNRQPWHVYHISDKNKIIDALSYQSGNRGFTNDINDLLIICSDIRAFNPGNERYQHWIDGGMYSMSLIYALHSKGIGSCCLNWSQQGGVDSKFRKKFVEIDDAHTIIMMLAIGKPKNNNILCASPRRPFNEVYSEV
ncbi:nitroreductase family protein [Photobacterium damselae]